MKSVIAPIIITLISIHLVILYSIAPYGYSLSSLIGISKQEKESVAPEYFQKGMVIFEDKGGYDGQFYYCVAMDPFLKKGHFKNAFRQQRILYPLIARLLAFGKERFLAHSLYLTNLLGLSMGMYFFILLLRRQFLHPMWSIFYGLSASSIMAILHDTPSALSIGLIIAATYFYMQNKRILTIAFMAAAFLAREDSIVFLLPLLIWDYQCKKTIKRIAVFLTCLIPFFIWQVFVAKKTGLIPLFISQKALGPIPFSGIIGYITTLNCQSLKELAWRMGTVVVFLYLAALLIITVKKIFCKKHLFYYVVMAYCLLALFTMPMQWRSYNDLVRMFYGLFPFLVLSYGLDKDVTLRKFVFFSAFFSLMALVRILLFREIFPFFIW